MEPPAVSDEAPCHAPGEKGDCPAEQPACAGNLAAETAARHDGTLAAPALGPSSPDEVGTPPVAELAPLADSQHTNSSGGQGLAGGSEGPVPEKLGGECVEDAKIRIDGLHYWSSVKEVRDMLKKLDLPGVRKVKKLPKETHGFVTFDSVGNRYAAEAKIQGHVWKKSTLSVQTAAMLDPNRFYKRQAHAEVTRSGKRPRLVSVEFGDGDQTDKNDGNVVNANGGICDGRGTSSSKDVPRVAADAVVPLRGMAYVDQLAQKGRAMLKELRRLPVEMSHAARTCAPEQKQAWKALSWLSAESIKANDGCPCPVAPVAASPILLGYRNKCEFTIGFSTEGVPCVGFMLGQVRLMGVAVGPPDGCRNVSPQMLAAVARVQSYLENSALPPYNKFTGQGFWRLMTVRQTFNSGDPPAMLIVIAVQHRCSELAGDEAKAERELQSLIDHLQEPPLDPPVRLSIATQRCDGRGEASGPAAIISRVGEAFVEESLLGLRFRISAHSFFQVNTAAAERLYTLLRSLCELGPDTVVLDVCCGTGTIGLSMAAIAKRIIGIEVNDDAVTDARANAKLNGIDNAMFISSKAELATRNVLEQLTVDERRSLVAVVDPPRAGLHNDVIKALRSCLPLKRIIYISCHAPAFVRNAIGFCRPTSKAFEGEPFIPVHAYPMDMFPDTEHCELVVVLERRAVRPQPEPVQVVESQV